MKLAVDVQYEQTRARAAGLLFDAWEAQEPLLAQVLELDGVAPYLSGQFYRRELPCILPLIQKIAEEHALERIIIDGYVDLGRDRPGLGRYLYQALEGCFQVIGVAKSPFRGSEALPLLRGSSKRPLWISATEDPEGAVAAIRSMAGEWRFPKLLQHVDALARGRA